MKAHLLILIALLSLGSCSLTAISREEMARRAVAALDAPAVQVTHEQMDTKYVEAAIEAHELFESESSMIEYVVSAGSQARRHWLAWSIHAVEDTRVGNSSSSLFVQYFNDAMREEVMSEQAQRADAIQALASVRKAARAVGSNSGNE